MSLGHFIEIDLVFGAIVQGMEWHCSCYYSPLILASRLNLCLIISWNKTWDTSVFKWHIMCLLHEESLA